MTSVEITEYFYEILNKPELINLISGEIYRLDKPKDSELEDIVINCQGLKSGYFAGIQNGISNINCYVKNINGVANTKRLTEISNKIMKILENYIQTDFYFEITQTMMLKELEQNSMSFLNIKLLIHK